MSVMSCSRTGCGSIMCDTYINTVGYVCDECKTEFKRYLESEGENPKSEWEITQELADFMSIHKSYYHGSNDEISIDDYFSNNSK